MLLGGEECGGGHGIGGVVVLVSGEECGGGHGRPRFCENREMVQCSVVWCSIVQCNVSGRGEVVVFSPGHYVHVVSVKQHSM